MMTSLDRNLRVLPMKMQCGLEMGSCMTDSFVELELIKSFSFDDVTGKN